MRTLRRTHVLGMAAALGIVGLPRSAAAEGAPRVLITLTDESPTLVDSDVDSIDDAVGSIPFFARWARPAAQCDPAPLDTLAGRVACADDGRCLSAVARRCDAQLIVVPEARAGRDQRVLVTLRLVDGERGTDLLVERIAAGSGWHLARAVRRAARRIARGGWLPGSIQIDGPPSGVGVLLDGVDVGTAPVRIDRLGGGFHDVALLADGHVVYRDWVEVEPQRMARVHAMRRGDRYAVSVIRDDEPPGRRDELDSPYDERRSAELAVNATLPAGAPADAVPSVLAFVVFEDRDELRTGSIVRGRGRVAPTYVRGGVGATLRLEFQ